MNKTNIWTRASLRAIEKALDRYVRWSAVEMPRLSGFVSCPYSVIQTGTCLRANHLSRDFSKVGRLARLTFGQRIFCVGFIDGDVGYGWCAQASNLIRGRSLLSSSANLPGECVSCRSLRDVFRSRPFDAVSPIPTTARLLPALSPARPART